MSLPGINLPKELKSTPDIIVPARLSISRARILLLPKIVGYSVLFHHSFRDFDH